MSCTVAPGNAIQRESTVTAYPLPLKHLPPCMFILVLNTQKMGSPSKLEIHGIRDLVDNHPFFRMGYSKRTYFISTCLVTRKVNNALLNRMQYLVFAICTGVQLLLCLKQIQKNIFVLNYFLLFKTTLFKTRYGYWLIQ